MDKPVPTAADAFGNDAATPLMHAKAFLMLLGAAHEDAHERAKPNDEGEFGMITHRVRAEALDGIRTLIEVAEAIGMKA